MRPSGVMIQTGMLYTWQQDMRVAYTFCNTVYLQYYANIALLLVSILVGQTSFCSIISAVNAHVIVHLQLMEPSIYSPKVEQHIYPL